MVLGDSQLEDRFNPNAHAVDPAGRVLSVEGNVGEDNPSVTSPSLLLRLRFGAQDTAAWTQFFGRYEPAITRWCRRWGLQEADAQDVVQDVLARLTTRLKTFEYDRTKSFRAYLKTLTYYAWRDLVDSRQGPGANGSGETAMLDQLSRVEARDDLHARLAEAFNQELLAEAMKRVQLRVEPHTWEAFRQTAIDGLSGAEAAARLGMEIPTVFKAKSKVQKMLREETRKLEEAL